MTAGLGAGRFGPVYLATDPATGVQVVVRVFDRSMTAEQQERFLDHLRTLCETPLEHASIAQPLESGVQAGRPYHVHGCLPGVAVDEYLRAHGRLPFSDVSLRVTHLAAAVDFAAAAGVCHGALGPRDILIAADSTGVSGFGLAQALNEAGVEPGRPSVAEDIYALAAMTYELLVGERYAGGDVRAALAALPGLERVNLDALSGALESALSPDPDQWPSSALQFAGSLHDSLVLAGPPTPVETAGPPPGEETPEFTGRLALHVAEPARAAGPVTDLPLFDAPLREPAPEPFQSEAAAPPPMSMTDAEPGPERQPMEALQAESPPFSASVYAAPAVPAQMGPPSGHRGESWLPHPLTVATLTVIVLVALGAGLFLIGDLGSELGGRGTGTGDAGPADRARDTESSGESGLGPGLPGAGLDRAGSGGDADPAAGGADSGFRDRVAPPPVARGADPPDGAPGAAPESAAAVVVPPPAPVVPGDTAPAPAQPPVTASSPASGAPGPPAAPARAAGASPAPEPVQGRVLVRSDPPGARVLIDDQLRGETPVAIRGLTLGTHTITVAAPGLPRWQREVTLTEDRPAQSFEIVLGGINDRSPALPSASAAALLQVDSRPSGAQVWVNGRLVGTTPLQLSGIEVGAHEVRLELPGYRPWTTSVSIGRGERTRVAASLEQ